MVTVKIKPLANLGELPLPAYQSAQAAGMDVAAAVEAAVVLQPGERKLIPCGFSLELPPGYEAQMRPRSGLALKHGLTLLNSPGTIDADYRGEVGAILINHASEAFTVERGMRIAQMVICALPQVELAVAEDLTDTERGSGGFGHSGIKA